MGVPSNISPDDLNEHYARISTDPQYNPPRLKHSASIGDEIFTEEKVFKILDSLKVTATGLDGIPTWFLRLGAPIFSSSLAALFNLSLNKSIVPHQWKRALISPIPKVRHAKVPSDFRPISITPVMSRITEKQFVKEFIYPSMIHPTFAPLFADQYAFRPTGSVAAVLIALLDKVTSLSGDELVCFCLCLGLQQSVRYGASLHTS